MGLTRSGTAVPVFEGWTKSEALRAAHSQTGDNKPLNSDHPQFEGFEVRQTVGPGKIGLSLAAAILVKSFGPRIFLAITLFPARRRQERPPLGALRTSRSGTRAAGRPFARFAAAAVRGRVVSAQESVVRPSARDATESPARGLGGGLRSPRERRRRFVSATGTSWRRIREINLLTGPDGRSYKVHDLGDCARSTARDRPFPSVACDDPTLAPGGHAWT